MEVHVNLKKKTKKQEYHSILRAMWIKSSIHDISSSAPTVYLLPFQIINMYVSELYQ